jgi:WD40 repeat protein
MKRAPAPIVALSPDGSLLATGAATAASASDEDEDPSHRAIDLWDLRTGTLRATLDAGSPFLSTLEFSPDGRFLVSVLNHHTGDGEVRLWDAQTGTLVAKQGTACFEQLVWSPDSRWVATSGCEMALGVIHVDGRTWRREYVVKDGDGAASQDTPIAATPDGKQLLYWVQDGRFEAYDVTGAAPKRVRAATTTRWAALAVDVEADRVALVGTTFGDKTVNTVELLTARTGARTKLVHPKEALGYEPEWIVLTPPGDVLIGQNGGGVLLVARDGGTRRLRETPSVAGVAPPRIAPDRRALVVAEDEHTCALWELAPLRRARVLPFASCSVAWLPDSRRALAAASDDAVDVVDLRTDARGMRLALSLDAPFTWRRDGEVIAVAGDPVRLLRTSTGDAVHLWTLVSAAHRTGVITTASGAWAGDPAAIACAPGADPAQRKPSLASDVLGL